MKHIDLSYPLSNQSPTYPSDPSIEIVQEKELKKDRTILHSIKMGTHSGTHLDTPAHIIAKGKTLEKFPLSSFSGVTIKISIERINDLDTFDGKVDGIIFDTGWYEFYDDPKVYFGSSRPKIPIPFIEKCIKLGIKYFGCDLPSVDKSGSSEKPIHNMFLKNNIIIYESLTNLNKIKPISPFKFYGFPLPFEGLDGCPVRAVAVIE